MYCKTSTSNEKTCILIWKSLLNICSNEAWPRTHWSKLAGNIAFLFRLRTVTRHQRTWEVHAGTQTQGESLGTYFVELVKFNRTNWPFVNYSEKTARSLSLPPWDWTNPTQTALNIHRAVRREFPHTDLRYAVSPGVARGPEFRCDYLTYFWRFNNRTPQA